ncbi:MAG: hypothetical protein H6739_24330 [Alphaproteobacteria bacterium]|nr:hypothetical protein [Alphaproteobacteria bacterium]
MVSSRERAERVLSALAGFPTEPSGEPAGVLAWTLAHGTERRWFADDEGRYAVDVPVFDPTARAAPAPWYAVIETDPVGVPVLTLPRGTQDLIATLPGRSVPAHIDLGQRASLLDLLEELGAPAPEHARPEPGQPPEVWNPRMCALNLRVVEALLDHGAAVRVESLEETAIRETREEHGFDLDAARPTVLGIRLFETRAACKRHRGGPLRHWVLTAQVSDFDDTCPRRVRIVEDKNPHRLDNTYSEQGTFATLPMMWAHLEALAETVEPTPEQQIGIEVAADRLRMIGRIERALACPPRRISAG